MDRHAGSTEQMACVTTGANREPQLLKNSAAASAAALTASGFQ